MSKAQLTIAYILFRTRENTGTKVVFQQVTALRTKGHDVSVYTIFGKPAAWFPSGISTEHVTKLLLRNPDILVATFWPTAYAAYFLRAKKKFYCIMGWEEDFYSHPALRFLARLSYKIPHQKIVLSDYLKKRLFAYTKKKEKVHKIVAYIINDAFYEKKVLMRPVKKKKVILSVISWYNRYKGPDLLVQAVKQLKIMHPEYRFVLAGREKYSYSEEVDEFHSNPTTMKLAKLYRHADCLLITSRVEGFYIPGLEAMANCLPVVTTDSGGVLEYAHNGKTAIVLKSLDELWKKDRIQTILSDRTLREKLVTNAYKVAGKYKKYSSSDLGRDLEQIYRS